MMDIDVYTKNKNSINIFYILTIFKILWFKWIVWDCLFHIKWNCAHETKQSSSPYHPWILLEQTWQLFQLDLHVLSKFAYTFLSYIFKKISYMNFGFGVIWTFGFFFLKSCDILKHTAFNQCRQIMQTCYCTSFRPWWPPYYIIQW